MKLIKSEFDVLPLYSIYEDAKSVGVNRYFSFVPAHSRVIHFRTLKYKSIESVPKFVTNKFYLNLPATVFVSEISYRNNGLMNINVGGFFVHKEKYYNMMLTNISHTESNGVLLPKICFGDSVSASSFYRTSRMETLACEENIATFFSSYFKITDYTSYFARSTGLYYYFKNKYFTDEELEKLTKTPSFENNFEEAKILQKENIDGYFACCLHMRSFWFFEDWSQKSKTNKDYSIFNDYPGDIVDLEKSEYLQSVFPKLNSDFSNC